MSIPWYLIVITVLIAILPALVVAVVLFLRQEAIRGDMVSAKSKVDTVFVDYTQILSNHREIDKKLMDVSLSISGIEGRMVQLDESFVNLTNKWNSRLRSEKAADKKRRREEDDEAPITVPFEEIPGTQQQTIPFDTSMLTTEQKPKRKRLKLKTRYGG